MKSSIYISTEKIEVIGYVGRTVKKFVAYNLPEGTLINGMITDSAFLTECLTIMRQENPGLFSAPSLIVDGSAILSRRLITPKLSHKRYLQLVRDDFTDSTEDTGNLVCGYYKLDTKDEDAVLACAVDKGLVDAYISAFKSAGIKLQSMHIGVEALVNFIGANQDLKKASFVLTLIDGFTAVSMIFENGSNVFMSRARLYGDAKEQIFQNVLDNLNGLINFNRSQKFSEITQCYYLGVSDADMRLIDVLNPYNGIKMDNLDLFKSGGAVLPPEAHFVYLNTLMPSNSINLIPARKELDKYRKSKKPKKLWIPLMLLYILILALPIAYMWWQVQGLNQSIDDVNAMLNNPANAEIQERLEKLKRDTDEYRRVRNQHADLIRWENGLVEITSHMLDLFNREFEDLARVERFEYSRNNNTVTLSALSYNPEISPIVATRFVDSLMESGMVREIPFTGYSAVPDVGTRISITVRLKEPEAEEAGE
jgi:hypothetical protein